MAVVDLIKLASWKHKRLLPEQMWKDVAHRPLTMLGWRCLMGEAVRFRRMARKQLKGGHMPRKYEAIRDKFEKEGLNEKAAKTKAAKIYNAERKRGQAPVTRNSK